MVSEINKSREKLLRRNKLFLHPRTINVNKKRVNAFLHSKYSALAIVLWLDGDDDGEKVVCFWRARGTKSLRDLVPSCPWVRAPRAGKFLKNRV